VGLDVSGWSLGHFWSLSGIVPSGQGDTPPFSFTHSSLFPEDTLREKGNGKGKAWCSRAENTRLDKRGHNICHPPPQKQKCTKKKVLHKHKVNEIKSWS